MIKDIKDMMIGDILMNITTNTPVQIKALYDYNNGMYKPQGADNCDDNWADNWSNIDELKGIFLTPEILLKNGFNGDNEVLDYRWEEPGCSERLCLYLRKMYNNQNEHVCWATNIGGVIPSLITNVHELQHLLRMVDLSEKAKTFKI